MTPTPQSSSCPICLNRFSFTTDGMGRLVTLHSVARCVPPVYRYEVDDDLDPVTLTRPGLPPRQCIECGKTYTPKCNSQRQQVCGSRCRSARAARIKLSVEDRVAIKTRTPRPCAECGTPFQQSTRFSAKQLFCSHFCKVRSHLGKRTPEQIEARRQANARYEEKRKARKRAA